MGISRSKVILFVFFVYLFFLGLGRWRRPVLPPVSKPPLGKLDLGGWPEIGLLVFFGFILFFVFICFFWAWRGGGLLSSQQSPSPQWGGRMGKLDLGGWPEIGLFVFLGLCGFWGLFGEPGEVEANLPDLVLG